MAVVAAAAVILSDDGIRHQVLGDRHRSGLAAARLRGDESQPRAVVPARHQVGVRRPQHVGPAVNVPVDHVAGGELVTEVEERDPSSQVMSYAASRAADSQAAPAGHRWAGSRSGSLVGCGAGAGVGVSRRRRAGRGAGMISILRCGSPVSPMMTLLTTAPSGAVTTRHPVQWTASARRRSRLGRTSRCLNGRRIRPRTMIGVVGAARDAQQQRASMPTAAAGAWVVRGS